MPQNKVNSVDVWMCDPYNLDLHCVCLWVWSSVNCCAVRARQSCSITERNTPSYCETWRKNDDYWRVDVVHCVASRPWLDTTQTWRVLYTSCVPWPSPISHLSAAAVDNVGRPVLHWPQRPRILWPEPWEDQPQWQQYPFFKRPSPLKTSVFNTGKTSIQHFF